jgi:hypothetical protein
MLVLKNGVMGVHLTMSSINEMTSILTNFNQPTHKHEK